MMILDAQPRSHTMSLLGWLHKSPALFVFLPDLALVGPAYLAIFD